MAVIAYLRQFLYPKEFRISKPAWDANTLRQFEKLQSLIKGEESKPDNECLKILLDMAIGLWRIKKKLTGNVDDKDVGRAFRHLEMLWDSLEKSGLKIIDKTGEAYFDGTTYNVLDTEYVQGIKNKIIKETITPTIYYKEEIIQVGEIIIGVPIEKDQVDESQDKKDFNDNQIS